MGRPKKDYDPKIIRAMVLSYIEQYSPGYIKYSEVHRYCEKLFREEKLNGLRDCPKSDFWKRRGQLGREIIDEFNLAYSNVLTASIERKWVPKEKIFDIIKSKNYDILNGVLEMNESIYATAISNQEKAREFEKKNSKLKEEIELLKQKSDEIENILLSWVVAITWSDNQFFDASREVLHSNNVILDAFNSIFGDFDVGYEKLISMSKPEKPSNENLVDFSQSRIGKIINSKKD